MIKRQIVVPKTNFISGSHKVFHWGGGVYRGYSNADAGMTRLMLVDLEKLYNVGLVRTSIAPIVSDDFGLILQHDSIDFISYSEEWTTKMLVDAALMVVDLQLALLEQELCLFDGHASNVLFDYTRPMFVDFGSIVPLSASLSWFSDFFQSFMKPIATRIGADPSFWFELGKKIIESKEAMSSVSLYQQAFLTFLREVRNWLTTLKIEVKTTPWSGYTQPTDALTNDKQRVVCNLLDKLYSKDMTLIDIGANQGWYSNLAVSRGYKVVAFDLDEACMTSLYLDAKRDGRRVLPLMEDFLNPWVAQPPYQNAVDRLKCDISLSLALVHHLVFSQHTNFSSIATGLSGFSKKYAIVEFPPADDIFVKNWVKPEQSWYTLDRFIAEVSAYFPYYEVFDSYPPPRKMVLFSKER